MNVKNQILLLSLSLPIFRTGSGGQGEQVVQRSKILSHTNNFWSSQDYKETNWLLVYHYAIPSHILVTWFLHELDKEEKNWCQLSC